MVFESQLEGVNFDQIPSDAVGVMSEFNNDPLNRKDTTSPIYVLNIVEKTGNRMILRAGGSADHSTPFYLGAILSADRETIYWVNETKPLP